MKFTLTEWAAIKCYLGTALEEATECAAGLEEEIKKDPSCLKDLLSVKAQVAQLENFIQRIETATV